MKRLTALWSLCVLVLAASAVPAKRGQWKTLTLADGTEIKAQVAGDEHLRYMLAEDGTVYQKNGEYYVQVDRQHLTRKASQRRAKAFARQKEIRRRNMGTKNKVATFNGDKHALVILVQFSDQKFASNHGKAKFQDILNTEGYTTSEGFKGSAHDYFKDQSSGMFNLLFDVVGPYTLPKGYGYYGANDSEGYDQDSRLAEVVLGAVNAAKADVANWKQYDWDNDGEADQVFILYAGYGEADTYKKENTIWPHMHYYSALTSNGYAPGDQISVGDGIVVDTYACGPELQGSGSICGIGTFCHEFSHCMGFPDFYDTEYDGNLGTDEYDLMCSGSYNGDQYCPAGYTSYEKWVAGWLTPIELSEAADVTGMKALSEGGNAYVLYNDSRRSLGIEGEYYLLENRQNTGWDASLPGKGLLVLHVDYDEKVWELNAPNTNCDYTQYYGAGYKNDHERMSIVKASNSTRSNTGWPYPYNNKNSLTNTTTPAATVFNANTDGKKFLNKPVTGITQNSDGTISFKFGGTDSQGGGTAPETPVGGDFYESFDKCTGTGGNDNLWSGAVASTAKTFLPDNDGWTAEKYYGGDQCARFGTGTVSGTATTPAITVSGSATLTFKAGAWNANADGTTLNLSVSDGTISPASVTLSKGAWGDYTATVTATGTVKITFAQEKGRFFLDEVLLKGQSAGISELRADDHRAQRIYTADGRYVGSDASVLPHGLYVRGGKKFVR